MPYEQGRACRFSSAEHCDLYVLLRHHRAWKIPPMDRNQVSTVRFPHDLADWVRVVCHCWPDWYQLGLTALVDAVP
ncbi:hypothetical protein [Bartonella tamiae]|uniref:hypothetical protein n=1 Tax=Bartonella tamiae TaxID=373638 RepID=UPI0018C8CCFF|nr:hypothetical protein [Bartonella tamiae]